MILKTLQSFQAITNQRSDTRYILCPWFESVEEYKIKLFSNPGEPPQVTGHLILFNTHFSKCVVISDWLTTWLLQLYCFGFFLFVIRV